MASKDLKVHKEIQGHKELPAVLDNLDLWDSKGLLDQQDLPGQLVELVSPDFLGHRVILASVVRMERQVTRVSRVHRV